MAKKASSKGKTSGKPTMKARARKRDAGARDQPIADAELDNATGGIGLLLPAVQKVSLKTTSRDLSSSAGDGSV